MTILLCLVQIILRYFTFLSVRPFAWGDEIIRLSSIWIIYLGISLGIKENAHFFVDYFLNRIKSKRVLFIIQLITDLIVIGIFMIITIQGFKYALTNINSMLQNINISMAIFYLSIPIGSCFCIFEYILKLIYGSNYSEILLGTTKKEGDK
jgi:TRAP-type C4-dicarboxylate transport system permease small subunit